MLTIWGRKTSSNVQAVMWFITELGLPSRRIDAGFKFGVVNTPEYLGMNPNGKVPTLVDGSNPPLWESGAILRYLANTYAPDSFWPADPVARALVDQWAEWSKINFTLSFTGPVFWRVVRTAPSQRDHSAIKNALELLDQKLDIAEAQLQKAPYLAGQTLTLADIQFGHCLYRYFTIDIERRDRPILTAYYKALTDRAAFADHVMISYEELAASD